MAATMNEANQLRYRNGELSAEVRMLTTRLAEANNANAYLLNQVSMRANDQNLKDIARLERKHKKALRENMQLKSHIGITRKGSAGPNAKKTVFTMKGKRDSTTTTITEDSADDLTDDSADEDDDDILLFAPHGRKLQLQQPQPSIVDSFDSLVDLSEHKVLAPKPTVQEKKVPEPPPATPQKPREISYGLSNLTLRTPRPIWEQDPSNGGYEDPPDDTPYDGQVEHLRPGFPLRQPDGTVEMIPLPYPPPRANTSRHDREAYSGYAPRGGGGGGDYFTDGEHNRLSGNAVFIEGMEGRELMRYWQQRASNSPRHTAREWRGYYEEKIRPGYLEKMRLRAEAEGGGSKGFALDSSREIMVTPAASAESGGMLETPVGGKETGEENPAETVENVEDTTTTSTKTAVQAEQAADVEAEVNVASHEATPSAKSEYFNIVPEASKMADPFTSPKSGPIQPATTNIPEVIIQEDTLPKPTEPVQTNTVDKEVTLTPEPLPGLSGMPPDLRHLQNDLPSARHQVVAAGNDPAQTNDIIAQQQQAAAPPRSRFLRRNIIPADDIIMNTENESPTQRRPFTTRRDIMFSSRDYTPSTINPCPPDCISDLFAKPSNFHTNPLAFRSFIMTIPPTVDLATALASIHHPGAVIYSATYLPTNTLHHLNPPSPSNHILLTLTSYQTVQSFLAQQLLHPIQHFCSETKTYIPSTTTLLPTASRPIPAHIQRDILSLGLSRVLFISSPEGVGMPAVPLTAEGAWRALVFDGALGRVGAPLKAYQDDETGKIFLEYASMREAKLAWERVGKLRFWFGGGVEFGFGEDPCGGVVEEEIEEDGGEGRTGEGEEVQVAGEGGEDGGDGGEEDEFTTTTTIDHTNNPIHNKPKDSQNAEKLKIKEEEADLALLRPISHTETLAYSDSANPDCTASKGEDTKTMLKVVPKEGGEEEEAISSSEQAISLLGGEVLDENVGYEESDGEVVKGEY